MGGCRTTGLKFGILSLQSNHRKGNRFSKEQSALTNAAEMP